MDTAANAHNVTQAHALLHGQETDVFGVAGYQGADKRGEVIQEHLGVKWHVAMRPGKRRALDKSTLTGQLTEALEKIKTGIRAKVEHPFRVIKRQFGYVEVKYRDLRKNTANLMTLFALSNLLMARRALLKGLQG